MLCLSEWYMSKLGVQFNLYPLINRDWIYFSLFCWPKQIIYGHSIHCTSISPNEISKMEWEGVGNKIISNSKTSFIQHELSMHVTTLTRMQSGHLILVGKKRFHHAVQMTLRKYDSRKLLPISSNPILNRNRFLHSLREGNVRQVCPI